MATTGRTYAQMRQHVLNRTRKRLSQLNASNNTASASAFLLGLFNERIQDVAARHDWHFLRTSGSTNTSANNSAFILPANTKSLLALYQKDSPAKLEAISLQEFRWRVPEPTTTGNPKTYLWKGGQRVELYPIPGSTYVMYYDYTYWPAKLSANTHYIGRATGSASAIANGYITMFEDAVMAGVIADVKDYENMPQERQVQEALYEKKIGELWIASRTAADYVGELLRLPGMVGRNAPLPDAHLPSKYGDW